MTDRIGSTGGPAPQQPKRTAAAATATEAAPRLEGDSFLTSPPTADQLKRMRDAVAALDGLPRRPSGVEAQAKWLDEVRPVVAAAEKAASGIQSASFFHKSPPEAEADAAQAKVAAWTGRVRDAEEATGQRKAEAPANPFRPLYGLSKSVSGWMGNNPFTAIVGVIALPITAIIDTVDMVTRPVQMLIWPAQKAKQLIRDQRYEAAHPNG